MCQSALDVCVAKLASDGRLCNPYSDMKRVAGSDDLSDYLELNIQFHKVIHTVAESPRLMNLIDQVMRESLVFRSRSLADDENIQKSIE